jgi:hypothetical protein
MLDPQIVVNLLLELGVGVDLMKHGYWLGERFKCGARDGSHTVGAIVDERWRCERGPTAK